MDITGTINPNQYTVSSVAIDTSDSTGQTAYVALMGFGTSHVFKTTNAGANWSDFSGTGIGALPSAPANTLIVDPLTGTVYVGTDVGVFSSSTTAPNWTEVGPSAAPAASGFLPNVPVTKLRIFRFGGQTLLRAATYGRGIWQYNLASVADYTVSIANSTQTVYPTPQQATFHGTLTALDTYSSSVTLSCTNGTTPPPLNCAPNPVSVTPLPTGAGFTVTAGGAVGDYSFNIHAVGTDTTAITHDQSVTLHVIDFNLAAPSPRSVSANRPNISNAASFQVTASGAFSGTVALTCNGLPTGTSCNFSPSSVTPTAGNPATVSLTVGTSSSTPGGTYPITLVGTTTNPAGTRTQNITLVVTTNADFSLTAAGGSQSTTVNHSLNLGGTLTALNGYNNAVNISCTGNPPASCSSNPATLTPTASGAPFIVTVSSTTAGTFNFNISAVATDSQAITHSVPVSLTVTSDFSVSNGWGTQTVLAGQTAAYSLAFAPVGSPTFGTSVSYACSGLPAGASCSFNPPSIAQGAAAMTVSLSISTLGPNAVSPRSARSLAVLVLSLIGIAFGAAIRLSARDRLEPCSCY